LPLLPAMPFTPRRSLDLAPAETIKDDSRQLIIVRKWIMVLLGYDAIWPR
jgi:hypothetical protein